MSILRRLLFAVVVAATLVSPAPAAADPVEITSGVFGIGWGRFAFRSYGFDLTGDDFYLLGGEADGSANNQFLPRCHEFQPCNAGDTTNLSGPYGVAAVGGRAELDGVSYDLTRVVGSFLFSSPTAIPIPSSTAASIQVQAPFTATASLDIDAVEDIPNWFRVGHLDLIGQGTVTATLVLRHGTFGDGYAIEHLRYEFADPVPEPATLLLIGSGLAAVVRARRRRT